jgi:CheY-like chemotaxis protein
VLLVDEQCASIEQQLTQPDLGYVATCAHNAMEALELLRYANGKFSKSVHYDIILADARLVAMEDATGKAFIDACEGVPVVLMAEQGNAKDVMRSVQLGAVDFLDKPLSTLKLKNIWQHCVRKMMKSNSNKNLSTNFEIMRPCYSELGTTTAAHTAPLPSSMTAPIVPGVNTGYLCPGVAGYAGAYGSVGNQLNLLGENGGGGANNGHNNMSNGGNGGNGGMATVNGKQVAPPQTPSGSDIEGAAGESTSAASNHAADNNNDNNNRSDDGDVKSKKKVVVRRKKLNEVAETREWPALEAGCAWGTPVGSVLPPPMVRSKSDTYAAVASARGGTNANANSTADTSDPTIQRCMIRTPSAACGGDSKLGMQSGQFLKNAPGGAPPLGLKLKKSTSLLNLINERLNS